MAQEKILFLGPKGSVLIPWLQEQGEEVFQTSKKLTAKFVADQEFSFLLSYGYRHILHKDIIMTFPSRAINLHISYLPWNRGADPNLWSFIENSPKGVTIHHLDESIDTGDIIIQKELTFNPSGETLTTSYIKLQAAIQDLFKQNWQDIKNGNCQRQKQVGKGSTHKAKDKECLFHLLTDGWNTSVSGGWINM